MISGSIFNNTTVFDSFFLFLFWEKEARVALCGSPRAFFMVKFIIFPLHNLFTTALNQECGV